MSGHLVYERFFWFDERVKAHVYPNASRMAEHFEISPKTAQRTIEFMRDRLFAPLDYVPAQRGYVYEDESYELPGAWIGEEELMALLVAYRLASTIPDPNLKKSYAAMLQRVLEHHDAVSTITLQDLADKVSVKNIAYSRTDGKTFQHILEHLVHARPLAIEYFSPHTRETTRRDILPLHLLHYMGTWHIIAHCTLKNDLRDFVLSRIKSLKPSQKQIVPNHKPAMLKEYIRRNFGIMNSPETCSVRLRFHHQIAPWIVEQVWHPTQEIAHDTHGNLCLEFPVADFREIKREILKFGSQVEVLSPPELCAEIKDEIKRMDKLYTK